MTQYKERLLSEIRRLHWQRADYLRLSASAGYSPGASFLPFRAKTMALDQADIACNLIFGASDVKIPRFFGKRKALQRIRNEQDYYLNELRMLPPLPGDSGFLTTIDVIRPSLFSRNQHFQRQDSDK